jgi:hypothetical protein
LDGVQHNGNVWAINPEDVRGMMSIDRTSSPIIARDKPATPVREANAREEI